MPRTATLILLMAVSLLMLPLAMSSLRGASTAAPGQSLLPICGEPRSLWNMGGDRAVILRADGLLEALPLGRPGAVEWSLNGANQAVRAGERLAVYTAGSLEALDRHGAVRWGDEGFSRARAALGVEGKPRLLLMGSSPRGAYVAAALSWGRGLETLGIAVYSVESGELVAGAVLGKYSAGEVSVEWLNETLGYVSVASSPADVKLFLVDAMRGLVSEAPRPQGYPGAVPRSMGIAGGKVVALSLLGNKAIYSDAATGQVLSAKRLAGDAPHSPCGLLAVVRGGGETRLVSTEGEIILPGSMDPLACRNGELFLGGWVDSGYNITVVDAFRGSVEASLTIDSPPIYISRHVAVSSRGTVYLDGSALARIPVEGRVLVDVDNGVLALLGVEEHEWRLGDERYRGCWGYLARLDLSRGAEPTITPLVGRGAALSSEGLVYTLGSNVYIYAPGAAEPRIMTASPWPSPRIISVCPGSSEALLHTAKGYFLASVEKGFRDPLPVDAGGGLVDYAWGPSCALATYTRDGYLRIYRRGENTTRIRVGSLAWGTLAWGSSGRIYLYGETPGHEAVLYVAGEQGVSKHRLREAMGRAVIRIVSDARGSTIIHLQDRPRNPSRVDVVVVGSSGVSERLVAAEDSSGVLGILPQGYIYRFAAGSNYTMAVDVWRSDGSHICRINGTGIPRWVEVAREPETIYVYWAGQGISSHRVVEGSCMPGRVIQGTYPEALGMRLSILVAGINATYQLVYGRLTPTPINDTFTDAWLLGDGAVVASSPTHSYLWVPGEKHAARLRLRVVDVVVNNGYALLLGAREACLLNTSSIRGVLQDRAAAPCIDAYIGHSAASTTSTATMTRTTRTTRTTWTTTSTHTSSAAPGPTSTVSIAVPTRSTGRLTQAAMVALILSVVLIGYLIGASRTRGRGGSGE